MMTMMTMGCTEKRCLQETRGGQPRKHGPDAFGEDEIQEKLRSVRLGASFFTDVSRQEISPYENHPRFQIVHIINTGKTGV